MIKELLDIEDSGMFEELTNSSLKINEIRTFINGIRNQMVY